GLDIGRRRGRAGRSARHRRERIYEQHTVQAGQPPVGVQPPCLRADPHDRAHGVEEVGEHDGEDGDHGGDRAHSDEDREVEPRAETRQGGPGLTMPAAFIPMKSMKSPMPTPMARLSEAGMACMIASRSPVSTKPVMTTPSSTMTPMAAGHGSFKPATSWKATAALSPMPE